MAGPSVLGSRAVTELAVCAICGEQVIVSDEQAAILREEEGTFVHRRCAEAIESEPPATHRP